MSSASLIFGFANSCILGIPIPVDISLLGSIWQIMQRSVRREKQSPIGVLWWSDRVGWRLAVEDERVIGH
jgi:hypothetical protein